MGVSVTRDEFMSAVKSCGYCRPSEAQFNSFCRGLRSSGITSKREAAMFLAQIIHESDGLRAKKEYNPPSNAYDWNDNGIQFFGRGYIQLTWRANYKAASRELYNDNRLVNNPDLVCDDEDTAWKTAFWYWKSRVHGAPGVIDGHFGATTKAINGALECSCGPNERAKSRFEKYKKVLRSFQINERPIESGCYN